MRTVRPAALRSVLPALLLGLIAVVPGNRATAQYPTPRPAPPNLLAKFDVSAGTVQVLEPIVGGERDYAVPIVIGGAPVTMALRRHDLRASGFRLLVDDATGVHEVATPECTTYRGELLEDPTTKIAASIVDGSVKALLYRAPAVAGQPGETWVVQPVRDVNPTAGAGVHVVFRATDSTPLPYHCGNVNVPQPVLPVPTTGPDTTYDCDIALEADVQFYQLNGSNVTATQNDVTSVMNQVEFIYNRDCTIQYSITSIVVTTTLLYTSDDPNTLLSQFANQWNAVHGNIPRDVAHLFTGRNLTGSVIGLSALSSICNLGLAYGLSQSRFTTNFNGRVGLTCHEVGHSWSAQHCDGLNPCYIMCSGLGGCSGNVTLFGPSEIGQITAFAATRSCLTVVPLPPHITTVAPTTLTVFNPVNLQLTGTNFTGVTSYTVGPQSFTSGFGIANDSHMSLAMPQGTALGLTTVTVTNPQGTSNPMPVIYGLTSPPRLKTTATVPAAGGIANFDFGGTPGRLWFLVLGITNTTSPFQGFPLLNNNLLLTAGTFPSPLGIDGLSVPVPGGLGFLLFYLQILEANPTLPIATGTSNIAVTILL